jgi:transcriptional regulator with XRE-family HTH domain
MDGSQLKAFRTQLNLTPTELGHAVGYAGTDTNLAKAILRFESGSRTIPPAIGRLIEMFDMFGVPRGWAGAQAQQKHETKWAPTRPATHALDVTLYKNLFAANTPALTVDPPVEAAPVEVAKPALSDQTPGQLLETARAAKRAREAKKIEVIRRRQGR